MVNEQEPVKNKEQSQLNKVEYIKGVNKAHLRYDRETEDDVIKIALYNFFWILLFTSVAIYNYYQNFSELKTFIFLVVSGGIGGTLYNIWHFTKHYHDDDFDPGYRWSYYFRPIIAAVIGLFTFYLILTGALSFSGIVTNTDINVNQQLKNIPSETNIILIYCGFSFLTGYAANGFIRKMDAIAQILFGEISQEEIDELRIKKMKDKENNIIKPVSDIK
jgi:hypothetical protein